MRAVKERKTVVVDHARFPAAISILASEIIAGTPEKKRIRIGVSFKHRFPSEADNLRFVAHHEHEQFSCGPYVVWPFEHRHPETTHPGGDGEIVGTLNVHRIREITPGCRYDGEWRCSAVEDIPKQLVGLE
jgi:RimJ/RimL family protein N-acetyltransferase